MAQLSCCTIGNFNNIPVCWFKLNSAGTIEPTMVSNSGTLIVQTTRFTVQANAGCYNLTVFES